MNKITNETFIKRIEYKFGEGKFDFSLLEYKDAHSNVKLKCISCGNIEEKDPTSFYRGFGCLKCTKR